MRQIDCDEMTVCRVDCVTSWSCDELTGSQKEELVFDVFIDSEPVESVGWE